MDSGLVLCIHDELLFEVPEDEVNDMIPLIKEKMENTANIDVPLQVSIKVGPR